MVKIRYVDTGRRGGIPENLIDNNVRTDYNKLRRLLTIDRRLEGNEQK